MLGNDVSSVDGSTQNRFLKIYLYYSANYAKFDTFTISYSL